MQPGAPQPGYMQPGAPQPGYPPTAAPPPGYPQPGMAPMGGEVKTNTLAIVGLICAFLCSLIGLVLSIVALTQINKSQGMQKGKGLAIAGIIISALMIVASIIINIAARM